MLRRTRHRRESLAQCYESTPISTPILPTIGLDDLRWFAVTRSPIHFEDGDMRRDYGWTRAFLTAAVVVGALAVSVRLLLTGLFVTFVTSDLLLVALFNLCLSVFVGRWLLVQKLCGPANPIPSDFGWGRYRTILRTNRPTRRSSTTNDRL